jgi:hypothetical protein
VEQELLTFSEHLLSPQVFNWVHAALSLVFCVVFCRSLFVPFTLTILLSVVFRSYVDQVNFLSVLSTKRNIEHLFTKQNQSIMVMFGRKDSLIFICVLPTTGPYFQCHMWWSFFGVQ